DAMAKEERRPSKVERDEVVLSPEQQAAAAIETRAAEVSREPEMLRVKGKVALADDRTWRVGVRTVGLVVAVYAGLGDFVRKGQVLARYHADEVRDSRALYRAASAELDRSRKAVAQAQRNRDRAQRLLELKAGSSRQVEQAQQDLADAQATIKKAQIEVDRLRDLLEDDLRVPADPPSDRKDETEDEVPIIAPDDGYIIEKNVTPGKSVELSAVTFVIGDISKVWMLASVREEDLGRLRQGQAAYVTLPGDTTSRFAGRITNLGQEFDPETRMMQVRIELNNRGNRLRPEMLANAEIPITNQKPALVIPSEAIQQVDGQDVVFLRKAPGHFLVRPVRIGETIDGKTPVLEGLAAGQEIAVRGSFILKSELLRASLESE
ncbi:MAG: efflux RND transporter periplasmic adaptor subunit, partial [Bryobacteraceae bacterium]